MTNGMQNAVQKPEKVKKRFWRFAAVLAVIFALGGTVFYFGLLDPRTWELIRQDWAARQLWKQIQQEQRREAEDPYGGQTPQETYQLFVDALKKEDIDLAVKYFAFEKQEKIRTALIDIKNSGKWQIMYDDFSEKTARVEYEVQENGDYDILIRALENNVDDNGLRAVIHAEKNPNSNLWKFVRISW